MLLAKEVEVKVSKKMSKYYKDLGYNVVFENGNKPCILPVDIKDLPLNSRAKVEAKCDYCEKNKSVTYRDYLKQINVCEIKKYACSSCYGKKKKEIHEYKIINDNEYKKTFEEKVLKNQEFAKTRLHSFLFIQEEFNKRGYKLLDKEYKGNKQCLNYVCPKHGVKQINYHNLSQGGGCNECANDKYRKDIETFKQQLYCKFKNKISVVGEYKNNNTDIELYCSDCDKTFYSRPRTVLSSKHGCSFCCQHRNEKILYDYISGFYSNVKRDVEFDGLFGLGGGNLSYDIGFEFNGKQYLVERQGEQHERPVRFNGMTEDDAKLQFEKQKEHDKRKRKYAKDNGYILVEVWYYEDYKEKLKECGLC